MSLLSAPFSRFAATGTSRAKPIDELYANLTLSAAVFFVVLALAIVVIGGVPTLDRPWLDGMHFVVGRDFLNTWLGARIAFAGGPEPWFNYHVYNEALRQIIGIPYFEVYWSYPPHIELLVWPLGLLPYLPAYAVWCAIGIALYLWLCSTTIPRERMVFAAFAPGVAVCVFFGQNGFYTAVLLLAGMLNRERRPLLAGVLFGILTIKPQLGLLVPIVLLLERRWIVIASAVATVAAMVAATALLYGSHIWIAYWREVVPQQMWLTETSDGLLFALVGSVFYGVRMIGLPNGFAWAVQYAVAALAAAAVAWTYWRRRDPALSLALLVSAVFLVTPYILTYDMVMLGFVAALLRDRSDNTMRDHGLLIAVWSLPVTMMLSAVIAVPLAPIVLIAFAARLAWRLKQCDGREIMPVVAPTAAVAA